MTSHLAVVEVNENSVQAFMWHQIPSPTPRLFWNEASEIDNVTKERVGTSYTQ